MGDFRHALLAEEEEAEEGRFEEEGKDALHGEGLADDAAGAPRELRPVGAELEFHGDTGDDAEEEVNRENLRPEARGLIPAVIVGTQGDELHDHHQQRQAHGELREQIVERNSKRKMDAVQQESVHTTLTVIARGAAAL